MRIAFFVSSLGDTDLAKATITALMEQNVRDTIFVIPLTIIAANRTEDLIGNTLVSRITIDQIIKQADVLSRNQIFSEELEKISHFINENNIQRTYVGVPSINNEMPFQIAQHLNIPCTIAYEYMFKPANHSFWRYVDRLATKKNCDFAVPLVAAKTDILEINPNAKGNRSGSWVSKA